MKRKKCSKQFKEEAVRAMDSGDKSPALLARELGVRRNQLYKWQKQVRLKGDAAFPGEGLSNGVRVVTLVTYSDPNIE